MSIPKRTITIDTNIQSLSKRAKNKSVKNANTAATIRPKLKTNQFIRPSTLKKQLLARIKTHQQKKNTDSDSTTLRDIRETKGNNAMASDNRINNNNNNNNSSSSSSINSTKDSESFSQSLEYLQSLAVNRKDRKQKTKTHRTNMNMNTNTNTNIPITTIPATTTTIATIASSPQTYLQSELPQQPHPQVFLNAFPSETVGTPSTAPIIPQLSLGSVPQIQLAQLAQLAPAPFESYVDNNPPIVLKSEPQWGCLKGGHKPTFRSFHNKTCKVTTTIDSEPNNNNNYNSESAPVVIDTAPTTTATTTTPTTTTTTATTTPTTVSDSESESERDGPDPVALSLL